MRPRFCWWARCRRSSRAWAARWAGVEGPSRECCPVVLRRPRSWVPGRSRPSPPLRAPVLAEVSLPRQPRCARLLAAARCDIPRARDGPRRSRTGAGSTVTVTKRSPPPPALPHVPVDTEHPSSASGRVRAALSLRRDGGVGRVSANTKTSGDAGHGGVVGERRGQGPPPGPAREVVVPERLACPARVATPRAQPPPHSARAAPHPHYQTRRAQNGRFLLDGLWALHSWVWGEASRPAVMRSMRSL